VSEKFRPYPYQVEGAKAIQRFRGRVLLADSMGLGKSIQSLMWLSKRPDALPGVICCPSSVKFGWARHVERLLKINPIILEGRSSYPVDGNDIFIINYDIMADWKDELIETGFKTLVLDEIQYCANPKTKRTKACHAMAKHAEFVLGLSGTPLVNRPVELFPGLNMIRPDVFSSFWRFAMEFCGPRKNHWGWEFKGATNIPRLNKLLRSTCMIRRTKAEVLQDLPSKMRNMIPIPLDDKKQYEEAEDDFLGWLEKLDPEKRKSAAKAESITKMGYLKRLAAELKMGSAIEWINNWLDTNEDSEKLVVFADHKSVISRLKEECNSKSVAIDGSVPQTKRKQLVEQFREDEATRLFIGNLKAAGTGLDGLQIANTLVFVEFDWRPGIHAQAEDRIHRIGLKEIAWIYYLISVGTIEEHLCQVIQEKQDVVARTLDGGYVEGDLDIFDRLTELMAHERSRTSR